MAIKRRVRLVACAAAILLTACSGDPAEPEVVAQEAATESSADPLGDVARCEDVLAGTPEDGENCRFDSDPTGLKLFGITPCPDNADRSYHVFDRESGSGTWFGVTGGEWVELEPEEFTQALIAEACTT